MTDYEVRIGDYSFMCTAKDMTQAALMPLPGSHFRPEDHVYEGLKVTVLGGDGDFTFEAFGTRDRLRDSPYTWILDPY
jgi:hypothetical protein